MKLETELVRMLGPFQSRLRAFAFGPELDDMAAALLQVMAGHRRRRVDLGDRMRLKALALLAEYLDAHGRSQEAAALLQPSVEELLDGGLEDGEDVKLWRQRVWCCLAYALAHLRAQRLREAGAVLVRVRRFVEGKLVREDFPCHGTVALLRYYEGLWQRNLGKLDEAARHFDAALDQTRMRYEDKKLKYEGVDPDRLRRELIYSRVMTARILGFGQGGIALARGRYLEARGWMVSSSLILSQLGQETWRKGLEVYARSAAVLVTELTVASQVRLREEGQRLGELAQWFAARNQRNAFVAEAFSIVAEVRVRQAGSGRVRQVDLSGLQRRIDRCLRGAYADAGPLTGSAALGLVECLLRGGDYARCETELVRLEVAFEMGDELVAEKIVLRAELWMETGREEEARGVLQRLVSERVAHRGYRARAWCLLALCEKRAGRSAWAERAITAAQEALGMVQDGLAKALVEELALEVERREEVVLAMPYQTMGSDERWCDVDYNLEMARLNVVAAVHARHPDYGVEQLAAVMNRGQSWLYALLGRHRDQEWVQRLMTSRSA
jgi:tetratricopeptide (TPR) repeat protein